MADGHHYSEQAYNDQAYSDQGYYHGGYDHQPQDPSMYDPNSVGFDMNPSGMEPQDFPQDQQFGQFDYSQPAVPTSGDYSAYDYRNDASYMQPPTSQSFAGSIMTPGPASSYSSPGDPDNFDDEPPLLEELGINFHHIREKTLAVLNPIKTPDDSIHSDTDLAGPLVFCLLFGASLLLSGKVHFGYIYGIGVVGCLAVYTLLNLMSLTGVSTMCVISVLGYCLLPMVLLSFSAIVVSLQGLVGGILTTVTVLWCSISASNLFVASLKMDQQQLLVAYPCALVYGVFALLTVF